MLDSCAKNGQRNEYRGESDLYSRDSGSSSCIEAFHKFQNHANDGLIADRSVDHDVVNRTVRPFYVEIFLDKIGALPIDSIHELFGLLLTLTASEQTAYFFFSP